MHSKIGRDAASTSSRKTLSFKALAKRFESKAFRDAYVSRQLRVFLATQMRALRGAKSQSAFGKEIGKPQSVISRLESEGYGNVTVRTLIEIAAKLNIALVVRFVSVPAFLRSTSDYSAAAIAPEEYSSDAMDRMIDQEERTTAHSAWDYAFMHPERLHAAVPGAYGAASTWISKASQRSSQKSAFHTLWASPDDHTAAQADMFSAQAVPGIGSNGAQPSGAIDETRIY
jgi:hypothetical protein